MNRKIVTIATVCIAFTVGVAYIYQPGSYVGAEEYKLEDVTSKEEFLSKADSLKAIYPEYRAYCIDRDTTELIDDSPDTHERAVYFCLKDGKVRMNMICIVVPSEPGICRLKLFSVSRTVSGCSGWTDINSNALSDKENERIKRVFESEILDKLGRWSHVRWYDF